MIYASQEVRTASPARRRLAATAVGLAGILAAGLVTAAPASAAVKSTCGSYICVATAYQGTRYVQDITVVGVHVNVPSHVRMNVLSS